MPVRDTPQTKTQHAVPQNVMDVEFKLIGDLTMRQFAYLLIGGIIAYICYLSVVGIFQYPLAIFFAVLGVTLAFGSYQDRGMDIWIQNFVGAMYQPTQRIWKKEPEIPQAFLQARLDVVKRELITLAPTSSRRKLEKFLEYGISEEDKDPLDIPEAEYILKVREAFAQYEPIPEAPVASQVSSAPASVSVIDGPPEPSSTIPPKTQKEEEKVDKSHDRSHHPSRPDSSPEPARKPERPETVQPKKEEKLGVLKMPSRPQRKEHSGHYVPLDVMTPDRHSGRRFSRILPSDGEIILPIRGEKVIQTTFEQNVEEDIREKAAQLQKLLGQIKDGHSEFIPERSSPKKTDPTPPQQEKAPTISNVEPKKIVDDVKSENDRLLKEITDLKNQIKVAAESSDGNPEGGTRAKMLEEKLRRSNEQYKTLQKQLSDLQNRMGQSENTPTGGKAPTPASQARVTDKRLDRVFTQAPNVLSGLVRDSSGGVLSGLLLLVKDSHGDPVRAFKTNNLGEFLLSTPLDNGMYTVEVSSSNNIDLTFDIISVEVKGSVIPPLQIIGS